MTKCQCGNTEVNEELDKESVLVGCKECLDIFWIKPDFSEGKSVTVVKPISRMEEDLLGETLFFKEIEKTHGYAKVADTVGAVYWVHPESLTKFKGDCHAM